MTAEFKDNNRSSKIDTRSFKDELIRFLDYRTYKDSLIGSYREDSILNFGISMPETSIQEVHYQNKMQFGYDSDKCTSQYQYFLRYYHMGRSVTLDIINQFSKKSNKTKKQKDILISVEATGTLQYKDFKNLIPFAFEEDKQNQENTTGQLVISNDTLVIKPIIEMKSHSLKKLVGIQLEKGTIVYAALQGFPNKIFAQNKIFLYTKWRLRLKFTTISVAKFTTLKDLL